jgi:hypothetical protein
MKITTADDRDTVVGRSTYRQDHYYVQRPISAWYYSNLKQHHYSFIV